MFGIRYEVLPKRVFIISSTDWYYLSTYNNLQATDSISKVASVLSTEQTERYAVPLVRKLTTAEWFTSRISAASLHAPVYAKAASSSQDELRRSFATLAADDTPMVRRAAAKHLGVRFGDCTVQKYKDLMVIRIG